MFSIDLEKEFSAISKWYQPTKMISLIFTFYNLY